jgi:hypothetical protein
MNNEVSENLQKGKKAEKLRLEKDRKLCTVNVKN